MKSIPIRDPVCLEPFKNAVWGSEELAKAAAEQLHY